MKRSLVLPVSAAAVGIVMAVGVFALKNAAMERFDEQEFISSFDIRTDVHVDGLENIAVEMGMVREALEQARQELEHELQSNRDLTDEQRERIQTAVEELNAKLEKATARMEVRMEEVEVRVDVQADVDADAPAPPGGN
jgi:hypothetical protein